MIYCPNCGARIEQGSEFCTNCGAKVAGGGEAAHKVCTACGWQLEPDMAFCPKCGRSAGEAAHGQQAPQWGPSPGYQQPPYQQPNWGQTGYGYSQKSRIVAGILGILLGGLGIHRFYLGYTGVGVAQILVTIFTFGIGAIWGFIEGIIILTGGGITVDANGVPLGN